MTDALTRIAAYKRADVAKRKQSRPLAQMEALAQAAGPTRGFARAIVAAAGLALIAEIKKASPSKGLIRADFDPPALAHAYAIGGATCLSVLTDGPSFQGADAYLAAARNEVDLPMLRKDFMLDPWQIAESRAGADAVLVILAMVDDALAAELMAEAERLGMDALVEVHDGAEMARATALGATLVGVNNRDLRTFATDISTFEHLAPLKPAKAILVAESGISTPDDARRVEQAGAKAMLVGESLMIQTDVSPSDPAPFGRQRQLLTHAKRMGRRLKATTASPLDFSTEHLQNVPQLFWNAWNDSRLHAMLTRKQHELLMFIHERIKESGVSPSFDEMKDALDLASKSGIHRLITALEERGFLRRLPHRARALEVVKLPEAAASGAPAKGRQPFRPQLVTGGRPATDSPANDTRELPILGRIAAGTPIAAIQQERERIVVPEALLEAGEHFVLEVQGDSMIEAGILDGDYVVIRKGDIAQTGEIVALVMGEEATLKRFRKKGGAIALEAANPKYQTRVFGPDQVQVQGKLVGLIRRYH